ncbi:MAG: glutamine-hydrolyzing GMP synthase [Myxococcaceae bacterium]|nr:glutamine-hydrolyzing GMP synthase [Myxococcaceae bacterium]MBH2006944.1 glutamine-hydrolyzing GMP synthase [Myxococcaceae bacterium]
MSSQKVLILDFGSQTTQLIARRCRELRVYSEIVPCTVSLEQILDKNPQALILSGGPASVYEENAPVVPRGLLELGLPVLGICYGLQATATALGGVVKSCGKREFGSTSLSILRPHALLEGIEAVSEVWMSHGDQVSDLPQGFEVLGQTPTCPYAVVAAKERAIFGVQFHPEVTHSQPGKQIIANFLFRIAGLKGDYTLQDFLNEEVERIRNQVGDDQVIMALSGGVDSSVAAKLLQNAIGDQLISIYVNHGLHRIGEISEIEALKPHMVDARDRFFTALKGVTDPEQKRKIIGRTFIEVFDEEAKKYPRALFLGQGTLYPDVIESQSTYGGPSAVIKSHHNVGGLPEKMNLKLLEPLRSLFKDEVRELGKLLGLSEYWVNRQPFPGPGLAVRILGEVTPERCELLAQADWIVREEIRGGYWQFFAVLLPVRSVGVMGDARSYGETICVRCIESEDGMTADWAYLPREVLARISNRIMNEVAGITRVVYDISSKPPATIEWE